MPQTEPFDPSAFAAFRFVSRSIDADGRVELRYALDGAHEFTETYELPVPEGGIPLGDARIEALLSLLHWVAGVSYFKTAVPPAVELEGERPGPATAALLEALYSEGLGEFAYRNELAHLPRPRFPRALEAGAPAVEDPAGGLRRVLVPVGGGKDSTVAIEIVRRSGLDLALFSVNTAKPIDATVEAAQLPRLLVRRRISPHLIELNEAGALNGHVPITAIVSCVALLTAALHGFDAVAFANERSASFGNVTFDGVEVNHQFSKSARVERMLRDAVAEAAPGLDVFSVLRPASELSIARAFAQLDAYHPAISSCNRNFHIAETQRRTGWCRDCDKCRFVFLVLAPFLSPAAMEGIFGGAMLEDEAQFDGFAQLTATGGLKPWECVGEVEESVAAIRLLAADPRWRDQANVKRLADEVLPRFAGVDATAPERYLALSDEHGVPDELLDDVHAVLGA